MKRLTLIPALLMPCLAAWHMMPTSVEQRDAQDQNSKQFVNNVTQDPGDSNESTPFRSPPEISRLSEDREANDVAISPSDRPGVRAGNSTDINRNAPAPNSAIDEGATAETKSLTLTGSIQALMYVDVPARREGMLDSLKVRIGSVVQEDQVIGRLNDVRERTALQKATADFNAARLKAENIYSVDAITQDLLGKQKRMKRIEILKNDAKLRDFVSPTSAEIDDLQATIKKLELERDAEEQNLKSAKAEAESRAAELALARDELNRSEIMSLASGIVTEIFHFPGDWMQKGDQLATVVRMDRLQVKVAIPIDQADDSLSNANSRLPKKSNAILGIPPGQWIGAKARILTRSNLNNQMVERTGRLLNIIPERMGSSSGDAYVEFENQLIENEQGELVWDVWLAQEATVILELPVSNDLTKLTSVND